MTPGLSEDGHHEIGASVDYLRVLAEIGCRVHHSEQLYDAFDAGEVAQSILHDGEKVDASQLSMLIGLLRVDVETDLAGMEVAVCFQRSLTGQEQKVAFLDMRHEIRNRVRRLGQRNAQFPQ